MSVTLSNEEKKEIARARQNAVRQAWKDEQARVREGKGTRDWTVDEQRELLERGSVKGYEGHHMKSVSEYPEYAEDPKNIQFLTEDEHFQGAHQGSYRNPTNGYYDPETNTMTEFEGDSLGEIPVRPLSERYRPEDSEDISSIRSEYTKESRSGPESEDECVSNSNSESKGIRR